jgi:hypothetical protein
MNCYLIEMRSFMGRSLGIVSVVKDQVKIDSEFLKNEVCVCMRCKVRFKSANLKEKMLRVCVTMFFVLHSH